MPKASCKPELRSPGSKLNKPTPLHTQGGRWASQILPCLLASIPRGEHAGCPEEQRGEFYPAGFGGSCKNPLGIQRLSPRQPGSETATRDLCPLPTPARERERVSSSPGSIETPAEVAASCIWRLNSAAAVEGLNRGRRGAGVE